eukprot:COSAG04_NODE_893_length_9595_cov_4.687763_1_plen_52_part_00
MKPSRTGSAMEEALSPRPEPEPETDDGYSKAPKHPAFMISRRVRTVVLMVG